jgi:hypothetical protein
MKQRRLQIADLRYEDHMAFASVFAVHKADFAPLFVLKDGTVTGAIAVAVAVAVAVAIVTATADRGAFVDMFTNWMKKRRKRWFPRVLYSAFWMQFAMPPNPDVPLSILFFLSTLFLGKFQVLPFS